MNKDVNVSINSIGAWREIEDMIINNIEEELKLILQDNLYAYKVSNNKVENLSDFIGAYLKYKADGEVVYNAWRRITGHILKEGNNANAFEKLVTDIYNELNKTRRGML